jgi:hypothetical protein
MAGPLQIQLTATAEATYAKLWWEADGCISKGDQTNPKVTFFRALDEALNTGIAADPFNPKNALSGVLSNVFRFGKENLRICYLGHGRQRRIIVLYICESGDQEGDSYATFAYMLMSGKFDAAFASLGIKPPDRRALMPSPAVN